MSEHSVEPPSATRARHGQTQRLYVSSTGLPPSSLLRWRQACEVAELSPSGAPWRYTTNDGALKIRSNEGIHTRRRQAHATRAAGGFAYTKWEPDRGSELYQDVAAQLRSPGYAERLSALVGEPVGVSDFYITIFERGDFLCLHEDVGLGKYAFTISLSSLGADAGGALKLYAPRASPAERSELFASLQPTYDQLLVFALTPQPMPHEVTPVSLDVRRISIAGFLETETVRANARWIEESAGREP